MIGNYNNKVLSYIVPIEAEPILLGRLWQFRTESIHDGLKNKISFTHKDKRIF